MSNIKFFEIRENHLLYNIHCVFMYVHYINVFIGSSIKKQIMQ